MNFQILRVNVSDMTYKREEIPEKYKFLGGRGLTSSIIADEVDPKTDPLGPANKIVFAPGILSGTSAPSSGRLSVGAKSPLTGGIKEANAGGLTATRLAKLGIKAVIIEGEPKHEDWYHIYISKDKVEFIKANKHANMGLYELIDILWKKYPKSGLVGAGIAGQRLLKNAGIFGNNPENTDPGRYAGRGGLGAVLGTKRIIAIITDDTGGERPKPKNEELFNKGRTKMVNALNEHAITGGKAGTDDGALKNYGTNVLQNIINEAGALPTKNFREGYFEGAKNISGEAVHELVDETNEKFGDESEGEYGHACHPGCIIRCSNTVPDKNTGKLIVSPLEYESAWSLGTNCTIDNLEQVAKMNRICNDIGIDTIDAGNAIAVAMEAGKIPWGDGKAAIEFMKKGYDPNDEEGTTFMHGAKVAGEKWGVDRVAVVKGQAFPAYDPRPIRGIGVTYATTTMGADHTAGYTIAPEILGCAGGADPRELNKADLSRAFQSTTAYIDQSGYCLFIAFAILDIAEGMEGLEETVAGFLGEEKYDITAVGNKILKIEREFNKNAGFTKEDDRLPKFFSEEKLPPHDVTFDVTDEELDAVFEKM
ncbi:MAG: aldehyde ferredoxin oxidoreductase family protein [Candidatus Heimdallarchaeaceae archaeon]